MDVLVIDSVAALVPRSELEGEMGDAQMGLQARLMSQALRKLTSVVSKSKTCLIFINQIREKIGVMFGNPETTTGGRALKFYASIRLDIRRIASLKEGDVVIGSRAKVKVVKNKVAPPFREAEFDILYGEGISKEGDLLDLGVDHKVIEKSGAWFAFDGERIGQGRENARQFLKDNPDIRNEIDSRLRKGLGLPVLETVAEAQDEKPRRPPWCRCRRRRRPSHPEGRPSLTFGPKDLLFPVPPQRRPPRAAFLLSPFVQRLSVILSAAKDLLTAWQLRGVPSVTGSERSGIHSRVASGGSRGCDAAPPCSLRMTDRA